MYTYYSPNSWTYIFKWHNFAKVYLSLKKPLLKSIWLEENCSFKRCLRDKTNKISWAQREAFLDWYADVFKLYLISFSFLLLFVHLFLYLTLSRPLMYWNAFQNPPKMSIPSKDLILLESSLQVNPEIQFPIWTELKAVIKDFPKYRQPQPS